MGFSRRHRGIRLRGAASCQSIRERQFILRWASLGGPRLEPQFIFHPTRRWKLDFAHPASRVAIEIHGGIFIKGRHTTGIGFWADRIKMNAAIRLDWKVFELTPGDLEADAAYREILDEINRRTSAGLATDRVGLSPFAHAFAESRTRRRNRGG